MPYFLCPVKLGFTANMKKEVIQFLGGIVLFGLSFLPSGQSDLLLKMAVGTFFATLIGVITWIVENWSTIKLHIQARGLKSGKSIRLSMAYLFRIEVQGKFLLVRNHRDQPGYQPVGGVYKFLKQENQSQFKKLGVEPCHAIPVDHDSTDDLRITIAKRKNVIPFLSWFDKKENRETDPWREFLEELICDGLLPAEDFPYIQYNLCDQHRTGIQPSKKFPTDELLHADIYELKWVNAEQKMAFHRLFNTQVPHDKYVFATKEEIERGHTADGRVILEHTRKLFK